MQVRQVGGDTFRWDASLESEAVDGHNAEQRLSLKELNRIQVEKDGVNNEVLTVRIPALLDTERRGIFPEPAEVYISVCRWLQSVLSD